MKEHELSYVFSYDSAKKFNGISKNITDYYLEPEFRFRVSNDITITQKTGDKASGTREENETTIPYNEQIVEMVKEKAKLVVKKTRKRINNIVVDVVESPIKIGILEVELDSEKAVIEAKVVSQSLNMNVCPLNAWDFNKRKIGIMGGPSSGKTTVAKTVSMHLNNNFGANTSDVVEYATSFIQKNGRVPSFEDQTWIYIKQKERENTISDSANIVLSDCPSFLSYIYALRALKERGADEHSDYVIKSLYKRCVSSLNEYQRMFILETVNYIENNIRYHSLDSSKEIYKSIYDFVCNHGHKDMLEEYTYSNADDIINDILYMNTTENINKLVERVGKYNSGVVLTWNHL